MTVKGRAETIEGESDKIAERKLEVEGSEAEGTLKKRAEEEEADVIPKEELEVKEAEAEGALKRKAEPGQAKAKVVPKGELGAEDAEAKMTLKRKGETIETESEVIAGKDLEAEDAEAERTLKKKAEGKVAWEQKAKIVKPETEVAFEEKAEVKVVPKLREEETEDSEAKGKVLSVIIGSLNETTFGEQGLKLQETFLYMEVQEEVIAPEEEKEQDESDIGDEVRKRMITLTDVEEALLIGIQQLITEVSQINEKDKEEPSWKNQQKMNQLRSVS
ncbi:hypothetical protein Chor_003208 [Crotalus horridus]